MVNQPGQGRKLKASTIAERERDRKPVQSIRLPSPPDYLTLEGIAEWKRVGKLLKKSGLIDNLDATALAAYCVAYCRWVEAEDQIRKHGMLVKAPNGYPMPSPYLPIANKAQDQMVNLLGEFGMTPAARTRLPAHEEGAKQNRPKSKWSNVDPRLALEALN